MQLPEGRILVTGGGSGLGKEMSRHFLKHGSEVVICGRRGDYLHEKAKIISEKTSNEVLPIKADVSNADDCKKLVEETIARFKKIDVLVNNAGIAVGSAIEDVSMEDALYQFEVNLFGIGRTVKAA